MSAAADIHDSGALLLQIISDIVDVAKVETGRTQLSPDWVDSRRLLASVVRLIEPRAACAAIAFETVPAPCPMPVLWADERLVKQALLNVLSNAVKFTPAGGRVRLTAVTPDADDLDPESIVFEVSDTGLGISPA